MIGQFYDTHTMIVASTDRVVIRPKMVYQNAWKVLEAVLSH